MKVDPKSKVLLAILDCYDGSLNNSVQILTEALKHPATCFKILPKLSREVFDTYDLSSKRQLFGIMLDAVLTCKLPEVCSGL
jgi:hypothetical protein